MRRIIDFLGGLCTIIVFGLLSVIIYWQYECDNCAEVEIDVYLSLWEADSISSYIHLPKDTIEPIILIQPVKCVDYE